MMRKGLPSDQNLCGQAWKTGGCVSLCLTDHSECFKGKHLSRKTSCMVLANCCLEVIFIRDNNEQTMM